MDFEEKIFYMITILPFAAVLVLVIVGIPIRMLKNRFAPVKTGKAVVIDKHKIETVSQYSGNGKQERYVVVFSVEGKKKSFYVSSFSYGGYRLKEKGVLKYKGDTLIDFK